MITKANQRGGGSQLAAHLLNEHDNERVEEPELRGAAASDLRGAFHEWYAQSLATRCEKFLYHLIISPDVAKYDLTREQYLDFIGRVERSLKLVRQPRAIVFHVKNGRRHVHAVWSRIDPEAGKAVHIAYDRMKRRQIAQEFARDHGLPLPEGMRRDGHKDRFNNKAKQSNHAEKQQEERTGVSKEELREIVFRAWEKSRDGHGFVNALREAGYRLARGDQRSYVIVDLGGEVHRLTRQLSGKVKAPEVKARLKADYPPEKLPDVEAARADAKKEREALKEKANQPAQAPGQNSPGREDAAKQAALKETQQREKETAEKRAVLARLQEQRRSKLAESRTALTKRHEIEHEALGELHASETRGILSARAFRQPKGLRAFIMRVTGFQMIVSARHRREDSVRAASQKQQREALQARHARERQDFDRQYRSLAAVEKRERYSLETALKRAEFQRIAQPVLSRSRTVPAPQPVLLKPEFERVSARHEAQQREGDSAAVKGRAVQDFDNVAPPKPPQPQIIIKPELRRAANDTNGRAVQDFAKAAPPKQPPLPLKSEFQRVAAIPDAQKQEGDKRAASNESIKREFKDAATQKPPVTKDAVPARPLTPQFSKAAGERAKEPLPAAFNRASEPATKSDPDALARALRMKEELERRLREQNRDREDRGPDRDR